MSTHWLPALCVYASFSGMLCQFTGPDEICPGDDVIFTCVVDSGVTLWTVSPGGDVPVCAYLSSGENLATCGPNRRFRSSRTEGSETATNSSLSVVSITEDLDGTMVECADGNNVSNIIGSDDICITGNASAPPFLAVNVTEINEAGCTLDVSWNEPVVTCGGPVSQYVLTLTPPTSDCLSSGDCMVMNGSSVITTPGTQTQYTFNVNVSQSDITVRADTCDGSLTGDIETNTADLRAMERANQPYTYRNVYNIMSTVTSLDVDSIIVNWPRAFVLGREADYRVVISNGSGVETTVHIVTEDSCTRDNCSYTFSSDDITTSYSVAVVVLGCVTRRVEALDISVFCDPEILLLQPDVVDWNESAVFDDNGRLGIYSFSGGNVTLDGVSLGSTATYTTNERYLVNGSRTFTSRCGNDNWVLPSQGIVAVCLQNDLLPCSNPTAATADNMLCCNRNSLCSTYTGLANGSTATYTTSQEYCIVSDSPLPVVRTCVDMSWSGEIPTIMDASQPGKLSTSNVAMIVIGLLFFIAAVGISVVVVILLSQRTTKGTAWCFPTLFLVIVTPVLETVLWLAFLGYVVANDFSEDDGYVRGDDSLCQSPSGTVGVRDGLLIASFVLSLLVLSGWLVCLTTVKCANPPSSQGESRKQRRRLICCRKRRETQQEQVVYEAVDPLSSIQPPVTYEEVGVAREVKSSQDIQLTSNEAYGPIHKDNIPTSHNTAYGQVHL